MTGQFDGAALRRRILGVSGLYIAGIPLLLIANIALARTLSVADFVTFGFALSLATALAIPVSGGQSMLLTREIAAYAQTENWGGYRGIVVVAYHWIATICLAFGLPSTVPPVGGPVEIVTDRRDGFHVDSREEGTLVRVLRTLLDAPEIAQAMSESARERALDFTAESFAENLRDQMALVTGEYMQKEAPR